MSYPVDAVYVEKHIIIQSEYIGSFVKVVWCGTRLLKNVLVLMKRPPDT